jgi:hypothetical protein
MSNDWMIVNNEQERKWSWHGLRCHHCACLEELRKTMKILSIFGFPVKIQTRHLSNVSQKHYHLSQLAQFEVQIDKTKINESQINYFF